MCANWYSSPPPAACLVGQVVVDLAFGNDQLAVDLALTQADGDHFVADLLAEAGVLHAILFQRRAELRHVSLLPAAMRPMA